MGLAMMGAAAATGENRAIDAAERAISSPLLEDVSIRGACGVLINITGGPSLSLHEVNEAATLIQEEADEDANIIFGAVIDEALGEEVRVTVIATGVPDANRVAQRRPSVAARDVPPPSRPVRYLGTIVDDLEMPTWERPRGGKAAADVLREIRTERHPQRPDANAPVVGPGSVGTAGRAGPRQESRDDLRPGTRLPAGGDSDRDRRPVAAVEELNDTLEIPTFLRRQSE